MEQLTEFVGKSFVTKSALATPPPSSPPNMVNLNQEEEGATEEEEVEIKPRPTKMAAAHMISNLLSTRLPPIVNAHHHRPPSWSLYPFSIFATTNNNNNHASSNNSTESETSLGQYYHPKLTLNSMVERFNEFKHQMSHHQHRQQHLHHSLPPHSHQMLEEVYKHSMFPFLHANSLMVTKESPESISGNNLLTEPNQHDNSLNKIDIEKNSITSKGKCLNKIVS